MTKATEPPATFRGHVALVVSQLVTYAVFLSGLVSLEQFVVAHKSHGRIFGFVLAACLILIAVQFAHIYRLTQQPSDQALLRLQHLEEIQTSVRAFIDRYVLIGTEWESQHDQHWQSRALQLERMLEECKSWCDLPATSLIPDLLQVHNRDVVKLEAANEEVTNMIDQLRPIKWGAKRVSSRER
ncbi:MAG: hypothetical protein ACYC1I_09220 [Acidimicrobiales bacterium]